MTVEELLDEFKRTVEQQPWSSAPGYDARRAGIVAVVRRLRDELYLDMGPGASWTPGEVERWHNQILGDAGEKVAECSSVALSPTPATDAAPAVCEWQMAGFNWDKRWPQCDPTSGPMFVTYRASIPQKCPLCFRPIKFTEAK